ncbi:ABC transporter ATP-binding protein [Mycoplana ramosa]|uniref:ABC transporter ATP-binding protein n=1 Tax=Mycoplana ramosa TaxID=40837 RepID=A0ABW3YX23_MYCRA
MADLLLLDGIRKSFNVGARTETEVLHGIDLAVRRGEFSALMGPSGSGKSTLLNIIGLLDRPSSGGLFINGQSTAALSEQELTKLRGHAIGFVFQYHHLISAFTARENVMMPMLVDRGRPSFDMERRADELLEWVGLSRWQDSYVTNISGGQQQRVAIARALAMNPPLILADEPTGNLDTGTANDVFDLMQRFNRNHGTTFLIVTHNHDLASRCSRLIELVDGRVTRDEDRTAKNAPQ